MVKPTVVCGSDTRAVTAMGMKRLGTWKRKILRMIHGPEVRQRTQSIRINQELRELYTDLDIVVDIRKKRLEWIGHVARIDRGRTVKKGFWSKPKESRRRGRPRLRWLVNAEKDLWEIEVKKWRQKAVEREE